MKPTYSNFRMRHPLIARPLVVLAALVVAAPLMMALTAWQSTAGEASAQPTQLLMLEEQGCTYCREWDAVIGPIFPKTDEGQIAPLRRVDIHGRWPEDLAGVRSDVYTPTFILVHEGKEIGRIRGYPGEDFFWGLFNQLISKLPEQARSPQAVSETKTSG